MALFQASDFLSSFLESSSLPLDPLADFHKSSFLQSNPKEQLAG